MSDASSAISATGIMGTPTNTRRGFTGALPITCTRGKYDNLTKYMYALQGKMSLCNRVLEGNAMVLPYTCTRSTVIILRGQYHFGLITQPCISQRLQQLAPRLVNGPRDKARLVSSPFVSRALEVTNIVASSSGLLA